MEKFEILVKKNYADGDIHAAFSRAILESPKAYLKYIARGIADGIASGAEHKGGRGQGEYVKTIVARLTGWSAKRGRHAAKNAGIAGSFLIGFGLAAVFAGAVLLFWR